MKNNKHYIVLVVFTLFFSIINIRCESIIEALFNGLLGGSVNSGNGSLALGDASVTQSTGDGDGLFIVIDSTTTDANGRYLFDNVSIGLKRLTFRKGIFADTMFVDIQNNQQYENVSSNLKLGSGKKLGYLYGERDSIQAIVKGLGYNIDLLPVSSFSSFNNLKAYSAIFINSGNQSISPAFLNNSGIISQYLDSGGRIYASDWAIQLLININAGGIQGFTVFEGDIQSITANILDTNLNFFLGASTASIVYKSNLWNSLNGINFNPRNLNFYTSGSYTIGGGSNISNEALSFSTDVGSRGGKVIYTTFRKETNITPSMVKILQFYVYDL